MADYTPLACHLHDYIEIACLYRIEVELVLHDGGCLQGTPRTTVSGSDRREYLVLAGTGDERRVDLTAIARMRALTPNRHFDAIDFALSGADGCRPDGADQT